MNIRPFRLRLPWFMPVALLGTVLAASVARTAPVHVGVLGGIGLAHMDGASSPLTEIKGLKGAGYGITLRIPIHPRLDLQPELLAVTDGLSLGELINTDQSGNATGTVELLHVLDRIQIPVLLRVTPWDVPRLRPFAFAGPYLASRLREYDRFTGDVKSTVTNAVLKSTAYGITLGAGLQTRCGPGQLELQGRYDMEFTDLGRVSGLGPVRARALRVMAGYSL